MLRIPAGEARTHPSACRVAFFAPWGMEGELRCLLTDVALASASPLPDSGGALAEVCKALLGAVTDSGPGAHGKALIFALSATKP